MNTVSITKPIKPTGTLDAISDVQRKELTGWLNSERTYKQIKELVETNFKIPLKTINPLKHFRKRLCESALHQPQQAFCPPLIPREVWESSLAKMVEELRKPDTKIETRVRVSVFLLQVARLTLEQNKLAAKARAPKNAKSKPVAEPNPLENADIEDIHRMLFGPAAPEEEPAASTETSPDGATA